MAKKKKDCITKKVITVFSSCSYFAISIQYGHHNQQDLLQLASKEKNKLICSFSQLKNIWQIYLLLAWFQETITVIVARLCTITEDFSNEKKLSNIHKEF